MQEQYNLVYKEKVNTHTVSTKFKEFETIEPALKKRRANLLPHQPNDLSQLDISSQFEKTGPHDLDLIYDNKSNNRIIILGLFLLKKDNYWID